MSEPTSDTLIKSGDGRPIYLDAVPAGAENLTAPSISESAQDSSNSEPSVNPPAGGMPSVAPQPQNPMQPFDPLKYQNDMKDKVEASSQWNTNQANKADFELCSNLMLLDTVALTSTVLVLSNDKVVSNLGKAAAIMLIITSICVVISIFLGVANYIMITKFQTRWAQAKGRVAGRFAGGPLSQVQMNQIVVESGFLVWAGYFSVGCPGFVSSNHHYCAQCEAVGA